MPVSSADVVIVGAGMAGLTAARSLQEQGCRVRVLEALTVAGGRLATCELSGARVDHGAQFFTTRTEAFADFVAEASRAGVVGEWSRGFQGDDGYPRYRGTTGMADLAAWMAEGIDVRYSTTVVDLHDHPADAYVLTAPVPQSLAILSFSRLLPSPRVEAELGRISYGPTLTVVAALDRDPALPGPGAIQQPEDEVVVFVADNRAKGLSATPAITIHAAPGWSSRRWGDPAQPVIADLLAAVEPWLAGGTATEARLERWRYALPLELWPDPCVSFGHDPVISLAGDAFDGPRVEGAHRSGLSAAEAVMAALG